MKNITEQLPNLSKELYAEVIKEAIASVKNVAAEFQINMDTLLHWCANDVMGSTESVLIKPEITEKADLRHFPDRIRNIARKLAKEKRSDGITFAQTAIDLGTNELSVRRWLDDHEYQKRGRKHKVAAPKRGRPRKTT